MRGSGRGCNIVAATELLPFGFCREIGWRWLRDRILGRAKVLLANKSKRDTEQKNAIFSL